MENLQGLLKGVVDTYTLTDSTGLTVKRIRLPSHHHRRGGRGGMSDLLRNNNGEEEEVKTKRTTRSSSLAVVTAVPNVSVTLPARISTTEDIDEVEHDHSGHNGTPSDTSQLSTQGLSGGGSTPRSPQSPTEPPNPPNNIPDNSPSHYVAISGGEGNNVRSYASLTPVNPNVAEGESLEDEGATSYVTYVEGSEEQTLYAAAAAATANGQTMSYPVYTVAEGGQMYSAGSAQYYSTTGSTAVTYQDGEVSYMVGTTTGNGGTPTSNGNSIEGLDGQQSLAHANRVSPATVTWLLENYETAEGVSLPRSTLYSHYLRHCNDHKIDPVNAASFGKLIRSVFLGLRTRRLGTRGNSKYHYYGIRLKPSSALNAIGEEDLPAQNGFGKNGTGLHPAKRPKMKSDGEIQHTNGISTDTISVLQYLGDPTHVLDDFPDIDFNAVIPDGICGDDLLIFRSLYRDHCENVLELVMHFQLSSIESNWRAFWRAGETSLSQQVICTVSASDYNRILPKTKLDLLCSVKEVQEFVRDADFQFYQNIVGILLPDVLRPIPSAMTQAIRNFAKGLEGGVSSGMTGYPSFILGVKVSVVNALAQTLRRYTSLNHLAQAARAVLQNQTQITQMLSDLNRVDFHNVEEQASWVCGCEGEIVGSLEADFKSTLAQQQSLEEWAAWLHRVVDRVLLPHEASEKFVHAARHFLLKWSFYSSLVIRDLTLRSAASFGSFHLLRLLYDEYMFYLVEHRVAQVSGVVPIAVIGKKPFRGDPKDELPPFGAPNGLNGSFDGNDEVASAVATVSTLPASALESHKEMKRVKNFLSV